jgi:polysaccharide biosynthesis transport protein
MSYDSFDTGGPMHEGASTEVDPRVYLRALWRWKWIFLVIVVLIPVAVYVVVSREHKTYESSALLEIQPVANETAQFSAGGAPSSAQILNATAALLTTTPVADRAARHLPPPRPTGRSLLRSVSASANVATGFITVTARAHAPRRAAQIANAFASAVAVTRANQAIKSLNNDIAEMNQELNSLPNGAHSARAQLKQQIQRDEALRVAQGSNAQILQSAVPAATPVSPHVRSAVVLALVAALLLGFVAVAVAEVADRRLRKIEDLERLVGSPALGVVPEAAFSGKLPTVAVIEAFHALQAALTYFNVDKVQRSLIVSSPAQGDGKTTVAIQLAKACALAGADVILIDADLRHPQIAKRLGIRHGAGLASVLAGKVSPEDALVSHEFTPALRHGSLRVLASTEIAPNPAQLLASERMSALLERLPSDIDRVIIDTSPALIVADSFPLFRAASGTLLVSRLNRTYKEAIRRLAWTVRNAGGTILGTVATGAESRDHYGRYDYGQVPQLAQNDTNGSSPLSSRLRPGRLTGLLRRNGEAAGSEADSRRVRSRS